MNSWLVTVLLLASAANGSGGQGAVVKGWGWVREGGVYQLVCVHFPPQVHKCPSQATHVHNLAGFLHHGQCTVSGGLQTCAIKEGAHPALLSSIVVALLLECMHGI